MSIQVDDAAEAGRIFRALGEGGVVQMPLGETFNLGWQDSLQSLARLVEPDINR